MEGKDTQTNIDSLPSNLSHAEVVVDASLPGDLSHAEVKADRYTQADGSRHSNIRRKAKAYKATSKTLTLTVGKEVNFNRIQSLSDCSMVGRMEII